jgi:hypothetical protein
MAQLFLANPHPRLRIEEKLLSRRLFSKIRALRAGGMHFALDRRDRSARS